MLFGKAEPFRTSDGKAGTVLRVAALGVAALGIAGLGVAQP